MVVSMVHNYSVNTTKGERNVRGGLIGGVFLVQSTLSTITYIKLQRKYQNNRFIYLLR